MKIAIILVRSPLGVTRSVMYTLRLLRLYTKHSCVIVDANPSVLGMIHRVKDYVTWGDISESVLEKLLTKRSRLAGKLVFTDGYLKEKLGMTVKDFVSAYFSDTKTLRDIPGLKHGFRLHPPRHGFEREGIKKQYSQGGVLGYRKDTINQLIERML